MSVSPTVEVEEVDKNLGLLVKTDEADPIAQRTSDLEARSNDVGVMEVANTAQVSQPQTEEGSLVVVTWGFELEATKMAPAGSTALDIAKAVTMVDTAKVVLRVDTAKVVLMVDIMNVVPVADVVLLAVGLCKTAKVALQAVLPVQVDRVALDNQALVAPAGFQESTQEEVGLQVSLVLVP